MIGPGRVDVVHSGVDGVSNLAGCPLLVDPSFLDGQAHASETQD